jgi:hypothetical protein
MPKQEDDVFIFASSSIASTLCASIFFASAIAMLLLATTCQKLCSYLSAKYEQMHNAASS